MQFINKKRKRNIVVAVVSMMLCSSIGSSISLADTLGSDNTQIEINSTQTENINEETSYELNNSDSVNYEEAVSEEKKLDNNVSTETIGLENNGQAMKADGPENAIEEDELEVDDFVVAIKKSLNFTGFIYEDGKWSFYQKGERKKGWIEYNGVKYYILKDYRLPQNMWRMIKGQKYYFNKDGVMIRDQKINIDGEVFQFNKEGHEIKVDNNKKVGEVTPEQEAIYKKGEDNLKNSVSNKKVGIIQEDGKWYKYEDGKKTRGWYQENGKSYYFLNTFNRAENMWRKIKGKLYYFTSDGSRCENGIRYIDGEYYKFNSDGTLDVNANPTYVVNNVAIREKADTTSKVLWNLKKDDRVNLISRSGSYAKVTTADGSIEGWVPGSSVASTRKETVEKVISVAKSKLGSPYVWGATGPSVFDCSGFTQYALKHGAGITIPRVSKNQAKVGTYVPKNQLKPGDFIFWGNPVHHVAIYIGDGKYIHAPEPGDYVRIAKLGGYSFAKRIIQ